MLMDVRSIRELYDEGRLAGRPVISFEFFPPKTEAGERTLFEETLPALVRLGPAFCSVTYGAGGSTRDKTLEMVDRIQRTFGVVAMAHLTCVNATREEIGGVLKEAEARGIRNILALRGDPPAGTAEFKPTDGGFEYAKELVRFIRARGGFCVGTAGFPEGHVACKEGKHVDWERLRDKVDAGADFVLTQLFYENQDFVAFWDYLRGPMGVRVPVVPGVLPVLNGAQIKRFAGLCGARLPAALVSALDGFGTNDEAARQYGIEYAVGQCRELLALGVPGLHFFTLNKAGSVTSIMQRLGLGGS
jgi:methylenetetrahydrofolate reductase (NADPH)